MFQPKFNVSPECSGVTERTITSDFQVLQLNRPVSRQYRTFLTEKNKLLQFSGYYFLLRTPVYSREAESG